TFKMRIIKGIWKKCCRQSLFPLLIKRLKMKKHMHLPLHWQTICKLWFFHLMAASLAAAEEELVVRLETDNQLVAVQFLAIDASQTSLPKDYVEELEEIFRFDL